MPDKFTYRSARSELMDDPDVPLSLLYRNLRELDFLNRYTHGHQLSIKAMEKLLNGSNGTIHVADLGCGSGDTLKQMARWARKTRIPMRFTGVDSNPDIIAYLQEHCHDYPEIHGVTMSYQEYLSAMEEVDIYHCSLFAHHLDNQQLLDLFTHFKRNSRLGFVVSDLIRSPFAYYAAFLFTRLANGTALAKHDGPLSVLRGFKIDEVKILLAEAKINDYEIKKSFGFRFLLAGRNNSVKPAI